MTTAAIPPAMRVSSVGTRNGQYSAYPPLDAHRAVVSSSTTRNRSGIPVLPGPGPRPAGISSGSDAMATTTTTAATDRLDQRACRAAPPAGGEPGGALGAGYDVAARPATVG